MSKILSVIAIAYVFITAMSEVGTQTQATTFEWYFPLTMLAFILVFWFLGYFSAKDEE